MAGAHELTGKLAPVRIEVGSRHPSIALTEANLATCIRHCGSCPSYPDRAGEALFCATGRSESRIEERGCNCLECPLYDQCAVGSGAYFCKHGACTGTERQDQYVRRFTGFIQQEPEPPREPGDGVVELELAFDLDTRVQASSDRSILQCAIDAGVPLTHVCGGRARCSTCRVLVVAGQDNLLPRNDRERRLAEIKGFGPDVRLACQARACGPVHLRRLVIDPEDASAAIDQGRASGGAVGTDLEVAVLFSDIRAFTSFSERALAYDLVHILNRYYEAVGPVIDAEGGYIDKYLGDGIMVLFGLEERSAPNPSASAVRAALAMRTTLEQFNGYLRERFDHEFATGIGICTGSVVLGSIGFHKKREFTAIGDTVNTASRIEAMTKETGKALLACHRTRAATATTFPWEGPLTVTLRGKADPVELYALDP